MAAVTIGGQYAVTATATSVTDIFSIEGNKHLKRLSIKNADDAVNSIYIGNSDVENTPAEAHIELGAGQSYDFYSGDGWLIDIDEIYIVGTANAANIAFINGMA